MLTLILLLILLIIIIIYIKINKKQLNENFTGFLDQLSKITDPTHKLPQNKVEIYKQNLEDEEKKNRRLRKLNKR
jgi:TM2 domain-containing membrane protein YozV